MQYLDQVIEGDCLEVMRLIPDQSVDMVLADLPYGKTRNPWDIIIPPDLLWAQYKRLLKPAGVVVLTAEGLFAAMLMMSNPNWYRYDWIWEKSRATGYLNARRMPLRAHEQALVFCATQPTYNPQKTTGHSPAEKSGVKKGSSNYGAVRDRRSAGGQTDRFPRSVLHFKAHPYQFGQNHPHQKPIPLFEYLIRTYTNPGEVVLDNVIGSGTTAVAALRSGRHFIGIEKESKYVAIARERIAKEQAQARLTI